MYMPTELMNFSSLIGELNKLKPDLVVAFGSYLQDPYNARDLDILLISDVFEGVYYQHRRLLLPSKFNMLTIDAYCFTSEEFRSLFVADHPFIKAIKKNHVVLAGDFNGYF